MDQPSGPIRRVPSSISHAQVTAYTLAMWCEDQDLAAIAEEWRACLAARAAMPAADRWDLAALERWAAKQDKAGTP